MCIRDRVNVPLAVIGSLGFVASVAYALRLVQLSVLGPNDNNWRLPNLSAREVAILGTLAVLILWLGLYPQPILNTARPFITHHSSLITSHSSLITRVGK